MFYNKKNQKVNSLKIFKFGKLTTTHTKKHTRTLVNIEKIKHSSR